MAGGEQVNKYHYHVEKVIYYEQKLIEYAHHKKYYKTYFKKYCYHKKMVHRFHKKGCGYYVPWPYQQQPYEQHEQHEHHQHHQHHQHHLYQPCPGMQQQLYPVQPNTLGPTPMGSSEMLANPARSLEFGEVDY